MLMTRAHPLRDLVDEFDSYEIDKHFPDLMAAPGAARVDYYKNVLNELPEAYRGSGTRMANYLARDLDELFRWLRSDAFAAAIEDGGKTWFGRMNELDGDLYTGNVYEVTGLVQGDTQPSECAVLLVERLEVTPELEAEFDAWVEEVHLPAYEGAAGVGRVRSGRAIREGIPLPYYYSLGNRVVLVEVAGDDPRVPLLSNRMLAALADSVRWDLRLPYVRRDVYALLCSADADTGGGDA